MLILALALSVWGCSTQPQPPPALPTPLPNTLRIVSSLPHRGQAAAQTRAIIGAIDLALSSAYPSSGPAIEHIALDSSGGEAGEWSGERERANAEAAANDVSVVAYIGPYNSGAAAHSLPVTNKAGLLQLSPSATWPGLTESGWDEGEPEKYYPTGKQNFARLMPPDSRQGEAAATWAASLGAKSAYILSDGSSYSDGLARRFEEAAKARGITIVERGKFSTSPSLGAQIRGSGADALFYAPSTVGNAVVLAQALAGKPLPVGVFVSDVAFSEQFAEAVNSVEAEGWRFIYNGLSELRDTPTNVGFKSRFEQEYGLEPTQFAANAYDLTNLIVNAVGAAGGNNREQIRSQVLGAQDYVGVTGDITFNTHGDVQQWGMSGYALVDGAFKFERVIEGDAK